MDKAKSLPEWLAERGLSPKELEDRSALDHRVVEAILHGRYTPSPQQRQRVAAALGLTVAEIAWGHVTEVQHLYGHGPQFGRTP